MPDHKICSFRKESTKRGRQLSRGRRASKRNFFFKVRSCKDKDEEEQAIRNPLMDLFLVHNPSEDRHRIPEDAFCGKASYPTASWKKMLVTSPAITDLWIFETLVPKERLNFWSISCDSGITIGQLAENQEGTTIGFGRRDKHSKYQSDRIIPTSTSTVRNPGKYPVSSRYHLL